MNLLHKNKINKIRSFALILIFVGLLVIYGGIFFRNSIILSTIFMISGCFFILLSTVIYLWIGLLSTSSQQIICPSCNKNTKILGKKDMCMYCNEEIMIQKKE